MHLYDSFESHLSDYRVETEVKSYANLFEIRSVRNSPVQSSPRVWTGPTGPKKFMDWTGLVKKIHGLDWTEFSRSSPVQSVQSKIVDQRSQYLSPVQSRGVDWTDQSKKIHGLDWTGPNKLMDWTGLLSPVQSSPISPVQNCEH